MQLPTLTLLLACIIAGVQAAAVPANPVVAAVAPRQTPVCNPGTYICSSNNIVRTSFFSLSSSIYPYLTQTQMVSSIRAKLKIVRM